MGSANSLLRLGAIPLVLALAGCVQPAAENLSPFTARASLQEIMVSLVDPAADSLWEAVSTEVTKDGVKEIVPQTEAEWQAVRNQAITLIEAANLLAVEGRAVAAPGKSLDDAGTPGIFTAEQVRQAIAADRAGFVRRARDLNGAAGRILAAIDARDPGALVKAGSELEHACEQCHRRYWYPNTATPKALGSAAVTGAQAG